jgi:hypothetical protein
VAGTSEHSVLSLLRLRFVAYNHFAALAACILVTAHYGTKVTEAKAKGRCRACSRSRLLHSLPTLSIQVLRTLTLMLQRLMHPDHCSRSILEAFMCVWYSGA